MALLSNDVIAASSSCLMSCRLAAQVMAGVRAAHFRSPLTAVAWRC